MRLIDSEALSEQVKSLQVIVTGLRAGKGVLFEYMKQYRESVLQIIDTQPTVDAAPVKTGKWKLHINGSGTCDQCRTTQRAVWDYDNWQNFCGHCGAQMIGVVQDGFGG